MKNTDKIRQLLKEASWLFFNDKDGVDNLIHQALDLLPCETCNSTGQVPDDFAAPYCSALRDTCIDCPISSTCNPCPDCQPTTKSPKQQTNSQQ